MPLISSIGSRSTKVRLVYGAIFAVLILGAVTMVYPLLVMLSGSVKGETDYVWATPYPEYLVDDGVLWMRYCESKYSYAPSAELAFRRTLGSLRMLRPPNQTDLQMVEYFRAFRASTHWPVYWFVLGHVRSIDLLAKNARLYRRDCEREFGDIVNLERFPR